MRKRRPGGDGGNGKKISWDRWGEHQPSHSAKKWGGHLQAKKKGRGENKAHLEKKKGSRGKRQGICPIKVGGQLNQQTARVK